MFLHSDWCQVAPLPGGAKTSNSFPWATVYNAHEPSTHPRCPQISAAFQEPSTTLHSLHNCCQPFELTTKKSLWFSLFGIWGCLATKEQGMSSLNPRTFWRVASIRQGTRSHNPQVPCHVGSTYMWASSPLQIVFARINRSFYIQPSHPHFVLTSSLFTCHTGGTWVQGQEAGLLCLVFVFCTIR